MKGKKGNQWGGIICKHDARWHHVSWLKVSAFCSSRKKNSSKQNTSAYNWDKYCHLGSDGASLERGEKKF